MRLIYALFLSFFWTTVSAQTLKDCSICATKPIAQAQIANLSLDEIRLLSNEIYARKGYRFESQRFQDYFERQNWYRPVKDNKGIVYNEVEKRNINFLQERMKQLKAERLALVVQLKTFKSLINAHKIAELKTQFGFVFEPDNKEEQRLLKEVFAKINLDDINYYRDKGLNRVTVDNGFVNQLFGVSVEADQVHLFYNYMSHSEIIKDFDEFTDYRSEDEFMYNWQFKYQNGKLKFVRLVAAG
ncbi:YARHG domain-containing protein [Pedobacter sp.]|uniref:YARHG domain-containing protein n=1 Tax=Pedobacter sp. TaxID=1411316 RepID=UPI0031DDBF24